MPEGVQNRFLNLTTKAHLDSVKEAATKVKEQKATT